MLSGLLTNPKLRLIFLSIQAVLSNCCDTPSHLKYGVPKPLVLMNPGILVPPLYLWSQLLSCYLMFLRNQWKNLKSLLKLHPANVHMSQVHMYMMSLSFLKPATGIRRNSEER